MIRPILILALLPIIGACRNADVLTVQEDNTQLRTELGEMLSRVEALEADAATSTATLDAHAAALAADREDIDALIVEIEATTGFDLAALVDDVDGLDTRLATLEDVTIASEDWVVAQGYATAASLGTLQTAVEANTASDVALQTTVDAALGDITAIEASIAAALANASALDARVIANAEGLTASNSAIAVVNGRVDGHVTQIEANTVLTDAVDERLTEAIDDAQAVASDVADNSAAIGRVEQATADLATEVSDISTTITSQGGGLTDLQNSLDGLATDSQVHADTIQANADGLAALDITTSENASILATYSVRLDGLDSDISGLSSTALTHTGLLSGLRTDTDANAASAASQGGDIIAAQSAIAAAQGAITTLNDDLDATFDLIGENATAISDNALDIAQVAAEAAEPRTIQRLIGQEPDGRDSGIIASRTFTFQKENDDSTVRITWFDNRRALGYTYGYWQARIDGELCVDPAPMRWWHHSYGSNIDGSAYSDDHYNASLLGYCRATAAGPIEAGEHTFTVEVVNQGGNRSDWYAGWSNTTFVVEMEEVY